MALTTRSKTLGSNTYEVTTLGARAARNVFVRLVKVAGPFVAAIADTKSDGGAAIEKLVAALSLEDFGYFCDTFAGSTTVQAAGDDRKPKLSETYEAHFSGAMLEQCKWLAFCLEVNFADFLAEMAPVLTKLAALGQQAKASSEAASASPSNSAPGSTGLSGESSTQATQP